MRSSSSCQHRGLMIAQKQAWKAGSKKANDGYINPHREMIPHKMWERRRSRETAKSTQLAHEPPAA
eukprot:11577686-Ditylum_brightwellii.AAC.1